MQCYEKKTYDTEAAKEKAIVRSCVLTNPYIVLFELRIRHYNRWRSSNARLPRNVRSIFHSFTRTTYCSDVNAIYSYNAIIS